jgi:uncharacterized protein YecE (DUF72 family)
MLHYYGEHFRAVEANSTFRALPEPSALEAWMSQVPSGFKFALKAPQRITHFQRLKNAAVTTRQFLKVAETLQQHLGPLLFQLPPNFKKDGPRLRKFLSLLKPPCRAAFEFRHPSWFDDETFDLLREHRAALCIADADDDLQIPFEATADFGYLRLRRAEYTNADLKKWARRVQNEGWDDVFIFFKHEDEAAGPAFAQTYLKLIK